MKLKSNVNDLRLVEDEMGNEVFRFTGLHYTDLTSILWAVNNYNKHHIAELEDEISNLDSKLDLINTMIYYSDITAEEVIERIKNELI